MKDPAIRIITTKAGEGSSPMDFRDTRATKRNCEEVFSYPPLPTQHAIHGSLSSSVARIPMLRLEAPPIECPPGNASWPSDCTRIVING